jgi:hypothetical protein
MKTKINALYLTLTLLGLTFATGALAEKKAPNNAKTGVSSKAPKVPAKPAAQKVNNADAQDGYVTGSSTHIDFSETAIDGKMKAPDGFMLQGHQSSSLSQMVKLRSNFRNELNNSKSATKALVK